MPLSRIANEILSLTSQNLKKSRDLDTPLEFRREFWRQKTRVPGLSYDVVCVILRLAVLVYTVPACDRQTDGRTNTRRQYIPR